MSERRGDLAVETWDALKGAAWPIFLAIGERTRAAGMTPAQISLLFVLFQSEERLTPLAVARILGVTPATVTGTLNPLEDMGLLVRERQRDDRRVVHLKLTPRGRTRLKAWMSSCRAILREKMAPLSPAEQRTLIRILGRIGPSDPGVPESLPDVLKGKRRSKAAKR